jgi:hypothetical protein
MVLRDGSHRALVADRHDPKVRDRCGQARNGEVDPAVSHAFEQVARAARLERDADSRRHRGEAAQQPGHRHRDGVGEVADPKAADRPLVGLPRGALGDVCLYEDAPRLVEHRGAGVGERDAAMVAVEQPDAQLRLELAHLLADGRLGDVQALGGPPEVQFFCDGHEVAEMPEFHGASVTARGSARIRDTPV